MEYYSYILLIYLDVQTEVSNSLNFANSETITEPTITKLTSTSITTSITVTNDLQQGRIKVHKINAEF